MPGELSKGDRQRAVARAAKVLPEGTQVRGVVIGRAQPRWSTPAIAIVASFVAIFVIGLLLGRLLYPGLILVLCFGHAYRPPRAIAVTDRGVATLSRSGLSGNMKDVVAYDSLAQLNGILTGSTRTIQVGPDLITLSKREIKQLVGLAPATAAYSGVV